MKILITGSSGQIGTNLGMRCADDGHEVLGIDQRANPWTNRFATIIADLAAPSDQGPSLDRLAVERPDVVVHLAAHAKVHELVLRPALAIENIRMAQSVLEQCRRWRAPIIFSSSREVYGNIQQAETHEENADFVNTASMYSASKIAAESMVHAYARCYQLPFLIFRLSNVYGRYDNDLERMERVVPLFISRIARNLPLTIFGDKKILDFTYVDDCVEALVRGVDQLGHARVTNETINIASGCGHSLVQLADFIGTTLRKSPRIEISSSRVGEVTRYVAGLEKARALLGYSPRVQLREGVYRAVAWSRKMELLSKGFDWQTD